MHAHVSSRNVSYLNFDHTGKHDLLQDIDTGVRLTFKGCSINTIFLVLTFYLLTQIYINSWFSYKTRLILLAVVVPMVTAFTFVFENMYSNVFSQ